MTTTPGLKLIGKTVIKTSDDETIRGVFIKVTKETPPGYGTETVRAKNAAEDCEVLTTSGGTILTFTTRIRANKFKKERKL